MTRSVSASEQTSGFSIDPSILKQFYPIDLVADEYLDQLVAQTTVIDIQKGEYIFTSSRNLSLSYYLLNGKVDMQYKGDGKIIDAADPDCYLPLDHKQPPETLAKALSPCQVLQFNRDFIVQLISMNPSPQFGVISVAGRSNTNPFAHKGWLERLSESPLLQHFSAADMSLLFAKLEYIAVRKGEPITYSGQPDGYFYIIKKGHAEICLGAADKNTMGLEPGDYFGEETMLSETLRSASIRMISDGVLVRLGHAEFNRILCDVLVRHARETDWQSIMEDVSACIVLDVRLRVEFLHGHCDQSRNVPINQLRETLSLFDRSKLYLIAPEGGRRSELATYMLRQAGFDAYLLEDDRGEAVSSVG